jgi:hypothetical protein
LFGVKSQFQSKSSEKSLSLAEFLAENLQTNFLKPDIGSMLDCDQLRAEAQRLMIADERLINNWYGPMPIV